VTPDWRPTAELAALRARAQLLADIRGFFAERGVLEVETPLLCQAGVTDPNLEHLGTADRYLQSSPEHAMKRLLAADSGPIYQVCKAFRRGESGARHNPEFSLLEWYRPTFDYRQLMQEVEVLVARLLGREGSRTCSYRQLFEQYLELDPFLASDGELEALARQQLDVEFATAPRDTWLDLLLSHCIEPQLAHEGLVFVCDYPASQAALARLREEDDQVVAERFELYVDGVEVANGYGELTDALEQASRFMADNEQRLRNGQAESPVDERLLAALSSGLPACAGVAMGLDRLLMLQQGLTRLDQVLSFSWHNA
jgi:lysyl-tRNA synthetase class 2